MKLKAHWPSLGATLLLSVIIVVIRPWSELPLNDDWQYAHFAKSFAQNGYFKVDVPVAPTVVGQSVIAWPVIKLFGFSHVALRSLTILMSVMILFVLDDLLIVGGSTAVTRFVALSMIVGNPLFLHLATTFMTENYGYLLALGSACIWFRGKKNNSASSPYAASVLAGASFWIRQFCTLAFPALIIAEWIASGPTLRNAVTHLRQRSGAILLWVGIIGLYFPWARITGNYSPRFSEGLGHLTAPDVTSVLFETGVFLFYITVILVPFLLAYGIPRRPSIAGSIGLCALAVTAAFAWQGSVSAPPSSRLFNPTFPFLNNVVASYGVGPITLTDVYWQGASRPRASHLPWWLLEALAFIASLAWGSVIIRLRSAKNEIAVFGIVFSLLSLAAVLLAYRFDVFDRYHYPGMIGFTIAATLLLPRERQSRFIKLASVWIALLALFSTLTIHDYFRWQEARARLIARSLRRGITVSQIDSGFEPNGWNTVELRAGSPGCGPEDGWFCTSRPYRIGLEQRAGDRLIDTESVDAWFATFPELKLLARE